MKVDAVIGEYRGAVVVPERAVIEGQAGSSVFVVNAEGAVATAMVKPLDTYRGLRVIESGLEPGTLVIVDGIQLVRPGLKVKTEIVPIQENQAPASSAMPTRSDRLDSPLARPRAKADLPPDRGNAPNPPPAPTKGAETP